MLLKARLSAVPSPIRLRPVPRIDTFMHSDYLADFVWLGTGSECEKRTSPTWTEWRRHGLRSECRDMMIFDDTHGGAELRESVIGDRPGQMALTPIHDRLGVLGRPGSWCGPDKVVVCLLLGFEKRKIHTGQDTKYDCRKPRGNAVETRLTDRRESCLVVQRTSWLGHLTGFSPCAFVSKSFHQTTPLGYRNDPLGT